MLWVLQLPARLLVFQEGSSGPFTSPSSFIHKAGPVVPLPCSQGTFPTGCQSPSGGQAATSCAQAGAGVPEHTLLRGPLYFYSLRRLPGSRTHPALFCPGFLSEAPRATGPDTPDLEVLGWRQAEGPFKGTTISSVRPEPPNHSSPTSDSSHPSSPRGPETGGEAAGRGRVGGDSSAVGALSNTLRLLRDEGGDIWTMRPWVRAQTHGSFP